MSGGEEDKERKISTVRRSSCVCMGGSFQGSTTRRCLQKQKQKTGRTRTRMCARRRCISNRSSRKPLCDCRAEPGAGLLLQGQVGEAGVNPDLCFCLLFPVWRPLQIIDSQATVDRYGSNLRSKTRRRVSVKKTGPFNATAR